MEQRTGASSVANFEVIGINRRVSCDGYVLSDLIFPSTFMPGHGPSRRNH